VAVQTVLVAFRTGMVVTGVGGRIDMSGTNQSWSTMIPGLTGEAALPYLDAFSTEMVWLSDLNYS
jgi:hypothetical protein